MKSLFLYDFVSRFMRAGFRAKLLVVAFMGTHIPLIALIAHTLSVRGGGLWANFDLLLYALAATLIGTAFTLVMIAGMLAPIIETARQLRSYRRSRTLPQLPITYKDEVGTLMADAQHTMTHLEDALEWLETRDAATGLPNRAAFLAAIKGDTGHNIKIVVVRVSNHAEISTIMGHEAAAAVLRSVALRLGAGDMPVLCLSRNGEAELAFLYRLAGPATPEQRTHFAFQLEKLMAQSSEEIRIGTKQVLPELRCGVAPRSSSPDAEEALENASAAALSASQSRPVKFFSEQLKAHARDRFEIAQELRAALMEDAFVLHYQPIVDASAGRVAGVEALIRWPHPNKGMVSPAEFIPVAEAAGLIEDIGAWVLRQACQDARSMPVDIPVAINVSARQFSNPDMADMVVNALSYAGLPPGRLEIELTETAALANPEHTRKAMISLHEIGVRTAIDDFGTGYASLSMLHTLPFHKLKMDREFVSGVEAKQGSQAICSAMIALGSGLGMDVLAEGAETEEEVAWLRDRGCNLFQGFHFSRPVPLDRLERAVRALEGGGPASEVA